MKELPRSTRIGIARTIQKIESGNFDIDAVKSVFISLRPACTHNNTNPIFLEIADLIAHPERDRGIIMKGLSFYLKKSKQIHSLFFKNENIDLNDCFPFFMIEILLYNIENTDPSIFMKRGTNKKSLIKFVKNNFIIHKDDVYKLSEEAIELIKNDTIIKNTFALLQEMSRL